MGAADTSGVGDRAAAGGESTEGLGEGSAADSGPLLSKEVREAGRRGGGRGGRAGVGKLTMVCRDWRSSRLR